MRLVPAIQMSSQLYTARAPLVGLLAIVRSTTENTEATRQHANNMIGRHHTMQGMKYMHMRVYPVVFRAVRCLNSLGVAFGMCARSGAKSNYG